ncbi:MAG TPA: translocation/assembly module TamB domain-containing protein, partial [Candidatus Nitrosotalea sp.]|nr:translocation/assembly module TamB domain-containing protein [Candidatus Nitrosotalea sp.]
NASVTVGSSTIALRASATPGGADIGVNAPHLDLADLNDFFDTGDTFAGTGSLALQAELAGRRIVATNGDAAFTSARFRRIALGTVAARWQSSGNAIATNLRFGGPAGEVALAGTIAPNAERVDLRAGLRNVDLATWLPMLGYVVPVTGRLDAQTTVAGTYPDLAMQLHAAVYGGTAGRVPIDRFEVTASAANGRGTLQSLALDLPWLRTTGSGSFGLRPGDRLAIVLHSTSENVGALINRVTGKDLRLSGALDSDLAIGGTRARPQLRDAVTITALKRDNLTIPRVAAELDLDPNAAGIRNGEIDLDRGRFLVAGSLPIRMDGSRIAPAGGPLSASLTADDVELSNLAPLLPQRTRLTGRIDGNIAAGGTVRDPQVHGSLRLRDGTFNGPMERSPITGADATIAFVGKNVNLQSHAFAGGGAITARGTASLADLRRPADATVTLDAQAQGARFDLPDYFQGDLNGSLSLARKPAVDPIVTGALTVYDARIPLVALLARKGGTTSAPLLPNVRFQGLSIAAGPNVRVQSANVDVGGSGSVSLGGTLAAPTLEGTLHSTGGSLSFYRNFNLQRGEVRFNPSSGIVPDVDAVATTFVADPATAIRLHATGPATAMNLELASDPSYDREQILGILVGAQQFGAVRGVQGSGGGGISTGSAVRGLAFGQLNTVFTRNMLEPLNASLGNALGFSEVQITSDVQTGLGLNAVKAFGKNVNAIFAQSFGYPRTQSVGLEAHPSEGTGLRLTAYSSVGPTLNALQQQPQPIAFGVLNLNPLTALTPITGQNGVTFSFERKFP